MGDGTTNMAAATVVLVLAMTCVVSPVVLGQQTSGRFNIARSCGDLRVGEANTRLQNLVVTSQLWLRTQQHPATLRVLSGQQCSLPVHTTFKVTNNQTLEVSTDEPEGRYCNLPRGTDIRLVSGEVQVSCKNDKFDAEEEMSKPSGPLPIRPVRPSPRMLDLTVPENRTGSVTGPFMTTQDPGEATPLAVNKTESTTTSMVVVALTTTTTTTRQAETTLGSRGGTQEPTSTEGDATEDAIATGAVPSVTTEDEATHRSSTELLPGFRHEQTSSNSSQYHDGTDIDHIPYIVGVGAGTFVLIMCIVVIAWFGVGRRRRANQQEDLFIAGSYTGSLARKDYDGSYHNAQVMTYSGMEHELAESFNLEEIVLKSQSSASEYETPKCLRQT